jgi:SAM-dependent methyltransferase
MTYDNYGGWKRWAADEFGKFTRQDGSYFAAELSRCGVAALERMHVLEIGFGNGSFAGWAVQQGAVYRGVELLSDQVLRGRENGFDVHPLALPLCAQAGVETQDLVLALDVFEHVDQAALIDMLGSVHGVLKPGGLVVARVPSGDSPFSRSIQHGDLTHRITLGSSAVHQLAASTGFVVEQVREPAFPLRGFGAASLIRRGLVKGARRLAYPLISRLLMGGGPLVLTPNMIFSLRKRQGV